jgi:hypothetical protein
MTRSRNAALLLSAFAVFGAMAPSQAEQTSPVCIYASKNYSEGAFLCVQKFIALICRSDGARSAWATVTDADLAAHCTSPGPLSRPRPRVRTAARHRDFSVGTAKCFAFNGKQYCE